MADDNCFAKIFFKKFPLIEEKTIETLLENGYQDETSLLFLDVDKDLPQMAIKMAQKSVLRRILAEYQESQKGLRKSFDKKLSEELVSINTNETNGGETSVQKSPPLALSTEVSLSSPPQLTPYGSFRCQQFLTIPSIGRELAALPAPPLPLPSADDISFLPSTSRSSHSTTDTPRVRRRFVRISSVRRTIKKERQSTPRQVTTCEKSTDSRYVLRTAIKTE